MYIGSLNKPDAKVCPTCGGHGVVVPPIDNLYEDPCPTCHDVIDGHCRLCAPNAARDQRLKAELHAFVNREASITRKDLHEAIERIFKDEVVMVQDRIDALKQ